jgi:hypothetical protein
MRTEILSQTERLSSIFSTELNKTVTENERVSERDRKRERERDYIMIMNMKCGKKDGK